MSCSAGFIMGAIALASFVPAAAAQGGSGGMSGGAPVSRNVLGPPSAAGPVVVRVRFDLHNINAIDDEAETFEFMGVMTLIWRDPRQAFDPAVEGVPEKVFQGNFQFNEISPGWFPQVVLVNECGLYQSNAVVLRVQPDGTSTLVSTLNATAWADFDMRRYPFDRQRLPAVFELLGFDHEEVRFQADEPSAIVRGAALPQWDMAGVAGAVRERPGSYAGPRQVSSTFVLTVDARRRPFYVVRLIVLPLVTIVLLSFAVFWMDRSSLGDRINVSFIGILTGVAYQIVMSQTLPRISYFTLMHAFLSLSFLTMCATVVINLLVGAMDKRGRIEAGDQIDRRCRWLFPSAYFTLLGVIVVVAFTLL